MEDFKWWECSLVKNLQREKEKVSHMCRLNWDGGSKVGEGGEPEVLRKHQGEQELRFVWCILLRRTFMGEREGKQWEKLPEMDYSAEEEGLHFCFLQACDTDLN